MRIFLKTCLTSSVWYSRSSKIHLTPTVDIQVGAQGLVSSNHPLYYIQNIKSPPYPRKRRTDNISHF